VDLKVYAAESAFAALVLAHGAGAGQTSPWMVRMASGLAARGLAAATFDFPYITAGRHVPDRAPVLEAAWRDAVGAARARYEGLPLFIGGKSMGGRIASHIASQGGADDIRGLVFFGYPLHPPGKPQQRRDAHLPQIREPILFVQGGADTFGTGDEIRELVSRLQRATLHEIPGGDHGFKVPKRVGNQDAVLNDVMDTAVNWARAVVSSHG
jgi:predicted alpha/beta-hydrolase family hydrolase